MKKAIKISLLAVIAIVILFVTSIFVFSSYYGDKITQKVITELNEQLNVKVEVKNIDFSIFKTFPNASINLHNIVVFSSKSLNKKGFGVNVDTLLSSTKLSLQLNILDVLNEKYIIQKIAINDSRVHVFIDKKGNNNFKINKADNSSDTSKVSIDLKNVEIRNCRYTYVDFKNKANCIGNIETCFLKGQFGSNKYTLETSIKAVSNKVCVNNQKYPSNITLELESSIKIVDSSYSINSCELAINNIEASISGSIKKEKYYFINIHGKTNTIKLNNLAVYLPKKIKEQIKPYNPEGKICVSFSSKGNISKNTLPSLKAKFSLEKGSFAYNRKKSSIGCKGVFYSKNIQDPKSYVLMLDTLIFEHNKSLFTGRLSIKNFQNLHVKTTGNINLNIEDVFEFTNNKEIEANGQIIGGLTIETNANEIQNIDEYLFEKLHFVSNLKLNNCNIAYKPNAYAVLKNTTANIKIENNSCEIDSCQFNYYGSELSLNGKLSNILGFVFSNKNLEGDLIVRSTSIDYNQILNNIPVDTSELVLPSQYNLSVRFEADNLLYQDYKIHNFTGQLHYSNEGIKLSNTSLQYLGGNITGYILFSQLKNKEFALQSKLSINNLQIENIFTAMNNFDQNTLTDKNIKGTINSDINVYAEIKNDFSPKFQSIKMECSAIVSNGRLIHCDAMKKLSTFVDVAELENISFSTIKNTFTIDNGIIIIPKMEIRSSAISMLVSGTHQLNNNFEYNIQIYLSELLAQKHKNRHPDEYFGEIIDDTGNTHLPIKICGTASNFKIGYDTKTAKQCVKENLKREKNVVAQLLNEEIGITKKDTTIFKSSINKKPKFEIEFE